MVSDLTSIFFSALSEMVTKLGGPGCLESLWRYQSLCMASFSKKGPSKLADRQRGRKRCLVFVCFEKKKKEN